MADGQNQGEQGGEQKHWTESKETFTPEMKTAFAKYGSEDDAFKGAFEAQKSIGKPYKLPESIDKLPDDKTRGEFMAGIGKLTGAVQTPEDLKDFNFKVGMPEGVEPDAEIMAGMSKFIVDKHVPKALAQEYVEYSNKMGVEIMTRMKQAEQADFLAKAKASDDAMIADPTIGSAEKLTIEDENVRRMFQNDLELTAEEYEAIAPELVDANFTKNVVLRKAMIRMARKISATGSHDSGGGGGDHRKELTTYEKNKARWPETPDLWGDPGAK